MGFVFKYDLDDPTVLHIYARDGTTTEDAITTFKIGVTYWNDRHRRFETLSETHDLFWPVLVLDRRRAGSDGGQLLWKEQVQMDERINEELEPYEMSREEETRADDAIAQAEREIEAMKASGRWGFSEDTIPVEGPAAEARVPTEAKVTMRWSTAQLDVVRRAADLFGMPYQTYVKQAAFRAALDDLQKLKVVKEGSNGAAA